MKRRNRRKKERDEEEEKEEEEEEAEKNERERESKPMSDISGRESLLMSVGCQIFLVDVRYFWLC